MKLLIPSCSPYVGDKSLVSGYQTVATTTGASPVKMMGGLCLSGPCTWSGAPEHARSGATTAYRDLEFSTLLSCLRH